MYTPVLGVDAPTLPVAGSRLHIVAAGPMPEGSSPELLGFSRVPDGGASGSVATGIPVRASAVGIAPKPASKRGRGGGGGSLLINTVFFFLPGLTTVLPVDAAVAGDGQPAYCYHY